MCIPPGFCTQATWVRVFTALAVVAALALGALGGWWYLAPPPAGPAGGEELDAFNDGGLRTAAAGDPMDANNWRILQPSLKVGRRVSYPAPLKSLIDPSQGS
jgi:hypothetical protein